MVSELFASQSMVYGVAASTIPRSLLEAGISVHSPKLMNQDMHVNKTAR